VFFPDVAHVVFDNFHIQSAINEPVKTPADAPTKPPIADVKIPPTVPAKYPQNGFATTRL
jgi:hypothetical protein